MTATIELSDEVVDEASNTLDVYAEIYSEAMSAHIFAGASQSDAMTLASADARRVCPDVDEAREIMERHRKELNERIAAGTEEAWEDIPY